MELPVLMAIEPFKFNISIFKSLRSLQITQKYCFIFNLDIMHCCKKGYMQVILKKKEQKYPKLIAYFLMYFAFKSMYYLI